MNSTSKPPPESGTQSKPNDSQWYQEDVTSIPPEARQLLEQYGNIAPDRVLPHVLALVGSLPFPPNTNPQAAPSGPTHKPLEPLTPPPLARQSLRNPALRLHRPTAFPLLQPLLPPRLPNHPLPPAARRHLPRRRLLLRAGTALPSPHRSHPPAATPQLRPRSPLHGHGLRAVQRPRQDVARPLLQR